MVKIMILGSNGLLGSYLYRVGKNAGLDILGVSRTKSESVDVAGDATDEKWVERQIADNDCGVVINAVKFKGSPDECEIRREDCWKANASLPTFLASIQKKYGYFLVQVSTDWVFEGEQGAIYDERSLLYPQNFYAFSKVAAELEVRSRASRFLILRTANVFGFEQPPRNLFVRLRDVSRRNGTINAPSDQYSHPTSALELSQMIYELLQKDIQNSILITTGPDYMSRFDFASTIATELGLDQRLVKNVTTADRKIRFPRYLRMNITQTEKTLGHKIKSVNEMIRDLEKYP